MEQKITDSGWWKVGVRVTSTQLNPKTLWHASIVQWRRKHGEPRGQFIMVCPLAWEIRTAHPKTLGWLDVLTHIEFDTNSKTGPTSN